MTDEATTCLLTKINANIGSGDNVGATLAAIEPNETVINAAKPSAVNGDDMTIGNCSAIRTPHMIRIVKTVKMISVSVYVPKEEGGGKSFRTPR